MKIAQFLAGSVILGFAAIAQVPLVEAQCPPNSSPVSQTDNIVQCRCNAGFEKRGGACVPVDVKFSPAAANLVNIMNGVAEDLKRPKGGYHRDLHPKKVCNLFFQGVGRELKKLGLPADGGAWNVGPVAQEIKAMIETDKTDWRSVGEKDVQLLANQGIIVVALSPGHVAIASPMPPDTHYAGKGPLLRDGNEHEPEKQADHRLYASSWGAIPSGKMFNYAKDPPKFFVWTPSESPASSQSKYKREIVPR